MTPGYQALRTSCAWIDCSPRGKIRVTGEDAGRLLHAMTTNGVKDLASGSGIYVFFLTDRGRIMADATVFRIRDEYWLDTEPETAHTIHHHLDKYIIADDANVTDETTTWFSVAIEGPDSPAATDRLGLPSPVEPLSILETGWAYVARLSSTGSTGFRVWVGEEKRLEFFDRLASSGILQATEEEAKIVRLEHGIPRYGEDITERYLVQETQLMRAVSFTKGCYLGQEIVERVRSQGKVHRLLTPIRVTGSLPPHPGSKLTFEDTDTPAGEVTSAAYSPALEEVVALAYLRTEVLDKPAEMEVAGMAPSVRARVFSVPATPAHEATVK
jgi:folate-binding protein YgfZ